VELVGAGLGDGVDDGAGVAAELGGEVVGLDAELFEGVGVGDEGGGVELGVVVVAAVEEVVVGGAAGAVDGDAFVLAEAVVTRAGDGSGDEADELERVAAVEREFGDTAFVDDFFEGGTDGFDLGDGATDGDGLRDLAELEVGLDLAGGVGVEAEGGGAEGAEAFPGDVNAVFADGELEEGEAAAGVGGGAEDEAGELIDGGDGGGGDDGTGFVLHGAGDLAGGLGEGGGGQEEEGEQTVHGR